MVHILPWIFIFILQMKKLWPRDIEGSCPIRSLLQGLDGNVDLWPTKSTCWREGWLLTRDPQPFMSVPCLDRVPRIISLEQ